MHIMVPACLYIPTLWCLINLFLIQLSSLFKVKLRYIRTVSDRWERNIHSVYVLAERASLAIFSLSLITLQKRPSNWERNPSTIGTTYIWRHPPQYWVVVLSIETLWVAQIVWNSLQIIVLATTGARRKRHTKISTFIPGTVEANDWWEIDQKIDWKQTLGEQR